MSYFSGKWPSSYLNLTGIALSAALLTACGPGEENNSSSSEINNSSVKAESSSSVEAKSSSSSSSSAANSSVADNGTVFEPYDHCNEGGFKPHATNGFIETEPAVYNDAGRKDDLSVQPTVYKYMYENGWQDAHVLWHGARGCRNGAGITAVRPGTPNPCKFKDVVPKQNTCANARDGLEFLAAHRLMRIQLKQLWPDHQEQFEGFDKFPRTKDAYHPVIQDYFSSWSPEMIENGNIADDIENNLDLFPTDGDLGSWIQCNIKPSSRQATYDPNRNMHFALHDQGVATRDASSTHRVNNTNQNIDSYSFWKLHGWIDNVWARYRAAKNGGTLQDPEIEKVMKEQCYEMDAWREISVESRNGVPDDRLTGDKEPYIEIPEAGYFHEVVRPAFEASGCVKCHGQGPEANLRLGDQITSTEIVERLINAPSAHANDVDLIVPGKPEESWLYLKATGDSASSNVTCHLDGCKGKMSGATPELLEALKQWIEDGAVSPTITN